MTNLASSNTLHVPTGWPNARSMLRLTMLRRLTGVLNTNKRIAVVKELSLRTATVECS